MSTTDEVDEALETLRRNGLSKLEESVVLLHCVTLYPTPMEHANLRSIQFLKERYGLPVGYSDHTLGTSACLAAVALGARVIEKHFTYRRSDQEFRDHHIAVEPQEMAAMIKQTREIESAMGTADKVLAPGEDQFRVVARRSLGLSQKLEAGRPISLEHLVGIRPATGIPLDRLDSIVGRRLKRPVEAGSVLTEEDLA